MTNNLVLTKDLFQIESWMSKEDAISENRAYQNVDGSWEIGHIKLSVLNGICCLDRCMPLEIKIAKKGN